MFTGPNNSGKTSAMQALTLWNVGLQKWIEKRSGKRSPKIRSGVTINRRDVLAVPHPRANLLWRDLRVRNVTRESGQQITENVRIDIVLDGTTGPESWTGVLDLRTGVRLRQSGILLLPTLAVQ